MRCFMIAATLLALVAQMPREATAKPPPPSGFGWYGFGYGHPYGYYRPVTPYVVQRPILVEPAFSGLPIKITNPAANTATMSYVLNGVTYSIPPGYSQDLTLDRSWEISFSRGGNFGSARYGLEPGLYTFEPTDHGWELYHRDLVQPSVVQSPVTGLPANPLPAAAVPLPSPAPLPAK